MRCEPSDAYCMASRVKVLDAHIQSQGMLPCRHTKARLANGEEGVHRSSILLCLLFLENKGREEGRTNNLASAAQKHACAVQVWNTEHSPSLESTVRKDWFSCMSALKPCKALTPQH